jgi:phospholipid-transporting ATPase
MSVLMSTCTSSKVGPLSSINSLGCIDVTEKVRVSLNNKNFILRGCSLRNTKYVFGVVCYTGPYTKIMLNSTKPRNKISRVEKLTYFEIKIIMLMQVVASLFASCWSVWWESWHGRSYKYLEYEADVEYFSYD